MDRDPEGNVVEYRSPSQLVIDESKAKALAVAAILQTELLAESLSTAHRDRALALDILHTAMDGFLMCDMRGLILRVNEALEKQTGYTAERMVGMNVAELVGTTEATIEGRIARVVEEGAIRFESTHYRADGSSFPVEVSLRHLTEAHSMVGGAVVAFIRDITIRVKQRADLTRLLGEEAHRNLRLAWSRQYREDRARTRPLVAVKAVSVLLCTCLMVEHDLVLGILNMAMVG